MENTCHTVNLALFQDKGLGKQETLKEAQLVYAHLSLYFWIF